MDTIKYIAASLELGAYPFHVNWSYPIQKREVLLFLSQVIREQQSLAVCGVLYVSFSPPSYVIAPVTFPNNGFDGRRAPSRGTYQVSGKAEAKAPRQEVP